METGGRPLSDIPAINRFLSYCRIRAVPSITVLIHEGDERSRRIVEQMRDDEARHGKEASAAGGRELPRPVRDMMRRTARVMTRTAYRI